MKAMILAAGRGERLRPLSDHTPKPLLSVGQTTLIEHLIMRLKDAGFNYIVINLAHLGNQIVCKLGDGHDLGITIQYSWESPKALETGGGIFNALPLLGNEPFVLVNGDIWTDYPFSQLQFVPDGLAHLVLVDNPSYSPSGDFSLDKGRVYNNGKKMLTYGCISVLKPELFNSCQRGSFPLGPLFRKACDLNQVTGEYYQGHWHNIGTPEQLKQLDIELLTLNYA
jgi:MurNAc alpha-1-phosphate uridylyltransferase